MNGTPGTVSSSVAATFAAPTEPPSSVMTRGWSWLVRNTARCPGGYAASDSSSAERTIDARPLRSPTIAAVAVPKSKVRSTASGT
jgi:hypothetical protein